MATNIVSSRALKETIAKTCEHIQKTRDLADFVEKKRERCEMLFGQFFSASSWRVFDIP